MKHAKTSGGASKNATSKRNRDTLRVKSGLKSGLESNDLGPDNVQKKHVTK